MVKRKKEKKDFQKIKLKLGRSLKKDTNVTNTSFKTKKINIKTQLKIALTQGLNEDVSTLKTGTDGLTLSLKELLSRLAHYNPSNRLRTVIRLKDLLTSTPTHITAHLSSIIEHVCPLMLDKDTTIRKAAQYVLNFVFEKVSEKQISPFFPIIGPYVCCAMTHIAPGIREDSLKFLDILLDRFQEFIATSPGQILNNFLEQISVVKSNGVRTLTVAPNERITSQKWRLSVLKRMEKFLLAAFRNWTKNNPKDKPIRQIFWDGTNPLNITIYGTLDGLPQHLGRGFSLQDIYNYRNGVRMTSLDDPESLHKFITVLIPLLVETWVESISSRNRNNSEFTSEELETLLCVLDVTVLLGDWIEIIEQKNRKMPNWLNECFSKDFVNHFMRGFPYSLSTPSKNKKVSGLELNLGLCQVYTLLEIEKDYGRVVKFLNKALKRGSQLPNITKVIQVVKRLIKNRPNGPAIIYGACLMDEHIELLLDSLWSLVQQWPPTRKDRQAIVNFFIELVLDYKFHYLLSSDSITSWLGTVAKDVVSMANDPDLLSSFLKGVRKICPCGYPAFLSGVQEQSHHIIDLLGKFKSKKDQDVPSDIQRCLVELIHAIPDLNLESFQALGKIARSNTVAIRNLNYMIQILSIRCFDKKNPGFKASDFLGFLLSLQFGISCTDDDAMKLHYNATSEFSHFRSSVPAISQFVVFPSDSQTWERHLRLTEEVSQTILRIPERSFVEKASYDYLQKLLVKVKHLPSHSVAGILNYVTTLQMANESNDGMLAEELCVSLVELSLAGLSSAILLAEMPVKTAVLFRCDEFLDMVLSFLQMTECLELLCEHLPKKFDALETLNEREAKCIGNILLHILKAEAVQRYHLEKFKRMLQKMQGMPGLKVTDQGWWGEVIYQLKMQQNEIKSGRRF